MARKKMPGKDESEHRARLTPPPLPSGRRFHDMPRADAGGGEARPWWRAALALGLAAVIVIPPLRLLLVVLMPPLLMGLGINWLIRQSQQSSQTTPQAAAVSEAPLAAPYRTWVDQGRAVYHEIQSVIARLPSTLRGTFWPLTQQARELVTDLENLARAAEQMDAYLEGPQGKRVATEAERLRAEIARCQDPVAREHLQQAFDALSDALGDQAEIKRLRERAGAEVAHINASLQGVLSEVIKQRYADLDTARQEYTSASERLRSVKSHVDAVQQVISSRPFSGE